MSSEDLCPTTSTRLFFHRLLFVALTAELPLSTAAIADTYEALCNVNNCQIIINEFGLAGPQALIAKEKNYSMV